MTMEKAVRRLQQVQAIVNDQRHILVLPSGENVFVHGPAGRSTGGSGLGHGSTKITIDGTSILDFRALSPALDAKLVLSAVGTPFEHSKQEPTPRYPVLELALPPNHDGTGSESLKEPPLIKNEDAWAAIYALWTLFPTQEVIPISLASSIPDAISSSLIDYFLRSGLARRGLASKTTRQADDGPGSTREILYLLRGAFWQGGGTGAAFLKDDNEHDHTITNLKLSLEGTSNSNAALSRRARTWLQYAPERDGHFPSSPSFTRNPTVIASHPLRAPKPPRGTCMYARFCAPPRGPGKTLTMHVFDPSAGIGDDSEDMKAFHRWMNDPRVGRGWGEQGSIEQHRAYVQKIEEDPHVLALVMCWDGERMGYVELTWIKVSGFFSAPLCVPFSLSNYFS